MSHSNVYVKGLPPECDESMLLSLFQPHGGIASLRLFQQPNKPPFAFVKFQSVQEAQSAISALNGAAFGGCIMEVRFADSDVGAHPDRTPPPTDNVFARGFAPGSTEEDVRQLFAPYGLVISVRVLHHGDQSGQGGAALVRLGSVEEAGRAVMALNGQRVVGGVSPLLVRFADSLEIKARKQAKQVAAAQQAATGSVVLQPMQPMRYSPNTPAYYTAASAAEAGAGLLGGGPFMTSSVAAQPLIAPAGLTAAGAASLSHLGIAYPGTAQVDPAGVYALGGDGGGLGMRLPGSQAVGGGQTLMMSAGAPGLNSAAAAALMGAAYGPTGTTSLYVRNMPDDAGKLWLYEKFAPFGAIHSVKVLTDESGRSKGCGFVNFADPVCGAKAVAALHNLPIGDRLLHVAFQMQRK
uniref:RRM domain-containing protein n=1 Tax=Chlamydomonas leiostraca TaxID=1034604 RepID=A0A7S0X196_9CHLO|mmetsp:Transcript_7799/g.19393  ORF Transcript_7799/g.19393 Transcript_7799/m.19393 type:complete len:408 (+) Transcript_7799:421-1644(+)